MTDKKDLRAAFEAGRKRGMDEFISLEYDERIETPAFAKWYKNYQKKLISK